MNPVAVSLVACLVIALTLACIPRKLPDVITSDNIGVLDMPLRYYVMLGLLAFCAHSHLSIECQPLPA